MTTANTEPTITWKQIFELPTETPEVAAALDAFLDEMAELAAALPDDETPAEPAA